MSTGLGHFGTVDNISTGTTADAAVVVVPVVFAVAVSERQRKGAGFDLIFAVPHGNRRSGGAAHFVTVPVMVTVVIASGELKVTLLLHVLLMLIELVDSGVQSSHGGHHSRRDMFSRAIGEIRRLDMIWQQRLQLQLMQLCGGQGKRVGPVLLVFNVMMIMMVACGHCRVRGSRNSRARWKA